MTEYYSEGMAEQCLFLSFHLIVVSALWQL